MQNKAKQPFKKALLEKGVAQGAIEYLLIIGVVIIIVAVAIIALSGILSEGSESVDKNESIKTKDPLREDLANSMNKYYIANQTINYFEYLGEEETTIGEIKKDSEGVNICLGNECEDNVEIKKDNIITVIGNGTIPKTDLNKQTSVDSEVCDDSIDNDKDRKTDCLDPDCDNISSCEYQTELTCNDNIDNDGDGLKDCEDNDCYLVKECAIYFEDFENGLNGWESENLGGYGNTWNLYTQSSGYNNGVSGSTIFSSTMLGVGERCAGNSCDDWVENSYILSPEIILPQTPLTFEIDSWSNNEGGLPEQCSGWETYDTTYLEISTDKSNWSLVDNCNWTQMNYYGDATLRHFVSDLSPYSGQTVNLRLRYNTRDGCCGPGEGWYVDNIWIHK